MNNNMNFNKDTMNNIKNMVDNGDVSGAISQISPEMLQNFSKLLSNNQPSNSQSESIRINKNQSYKNSYMQNSNNVNLSNFNNKNSNSSDVNNDLGNIDMETIIKLSSAIGKIKNNKNDPRANLLNSLKPYLRNEKKEKIDEYMELLNITKIAEIMNDKNNGK